LNGALNRMPVNFYDRVWTILSRSKEGIVIASQFLPQWDLGTKHLKGFVYFCRAFQQPTLSDMTEFELTFAYKIEEMLSRIAHPEYRQLLVELLSIIATILERNPEVMFGSGPVDCDLLIKQGFHLYADAQKIANKEDLTPFYQLENLSMHTSTATYLGKV
uniref:Phosphorylase b kinase regulatory subunit n=1 Tax=Haemonchus placei TaxID=6290 RepID=A0A0N4W9K1_HAEPC